MTRTLLKLSKLVVCLAMLITSLLAGEAQAQVVVVVRPPATFLATARPVRHDGRMAYWYNNRWIYRHGGSWAAYRTEPVFLRNHRMRYVPVRHVYYRGHRR
jgi:hypothetical protein